MARSIRLVGRTNRRGDYNPISTDNNDDNYDGLATVADVEDGEIVDNNSLASADEHSAVELLRDENSSTATDTSDNDDGDDERKVKDADDSYDIDNSNDAEDEKNLLVDEEDSMMKVIVLDPMQSKFEVKAEPSWTISRFKSSGELVHKVPPAAQRLIYRGRLLTDDSTLEDAGITKDNIIIHLFPKPRVVVLSDDNKRSGGNNSTTNSTCGSNVHDEISDEDDDNNISSGAHIPQIIIDADEADRRSSILVLGSPHFVEAQNNVKLLSFLLLVFSSFELLNLFATLMGVPEEEQEQGSLYDDTLFSIPTMPPTENITMAMNNTTSYYSDSNPEMLTWHMYHNFDLIISAVGFWVAMVGIQATNENTILLAKKYMYGTFIVGVAWMIYNYIRSVQIDQEIEGKREEDRATRFGNETHHDNYTDDMFTPMNDSDIYAQSFQVMLLPAIVWILCCVRAWQFHYLLSEAEREAEDRIQDSNNDIEYGGSNSNSSMASEQQRTAVQHDHELELQNEAAVIA